MSFVTPCNDGRSPSFSWQPVLSYAEKGEGGAVVLLHAYPLDRSMWQSQVDALAARFRVIAPDVIGFGGSKPARPWTMAEMGDELLGLLDRLHVDRCCLAGLSMGGYIALPFAAAHPERVSRLVLAHTRARGDSAAERAARNDMIAALERDGVRILPDRMLPRLLGASATEQVRNFVRAAIDRTEAGAAIAAVTAMRDRPDATGCLPRLQCPVLVIAGGEDVIMNAEEARGMAEAAADGRLEVIPKAGHLGNLEAPDAFNRILADFLV